MKTCFLSYSRIACVLLTILSATTQTGAQTYKIVNRQSGKVLDVTGGVDQSAFQNTTRIQQWDWLGGLNQQWTLMPTDSGFYAIVNRQSNKVLDVVNASVSNTALIQQYDWLGGSNQQWQVIPTDSGFNRIVSRSSGKVLDLPGGVSDNGVQIQQYDWLAGINQQWAFVLVPTVEVTNLTHPGLAPNFLAGDSYQYVIRGLPNQPVYQTQNGYTQLYGTTDSNGVFTTTGVEQTAWIGSYTQAWSVGDTLATPALTFIVDQLSGGGTVVSTGAAQTADGNIVGVSSISVTGGTATTYSLTELDDQASYYYGSETVGTLYQNGTQIQQGYDSQQRGTSGGTLYASAPYWQDFTLQTDHYAVAYFLYGSSFYNPFQYQQGSCLDYSGDCTYWPGSGYYYLASAEILLGSTLVDQSVAPDETYWGNAVLQNPTGLPGSIQYRVNKWSDAVIAAATLGAIAQRKHTDYRIPGYLEGSPDCPLKVAALR